MSSFTRLRQRRVAAAFLLSFVGGAHATTGAALSSSASFGALALLKVLLALALVLAAIVTVAWLIRRLNPPQYANGLMRVIGAVPVGPRERLVLVEIGETWFVLGVGPGHISTVHTLPKQVASSDEAIRGGAQGWLGRALGKREG